MSHPRSSFLGILLLACAAPLTAQSTTLVSVGAGAGAGGGTAGGASREPALSRTGTVIAFSSFATDLLAGGDAGGDGIEDLFVRDLLTGTVTCVSLAADGGPADGSSSSPVLSASGRFVAFQSDATNLVPDDRNGMTDVFMHDRRSGLTLRASVSSTGAEANAECVEPALSDDGATLAFHSYATTLVPGSGPGTRHVYVRDLLAGLTTLASVSSDGAPGNSFSGFPTLSGDGRLVAFESEAQNLVPGDSNGTHDIFVHDRLTGATQRASLGPGGVQANSSSHLAALSADGRHLAFESFATNLVFGDVNDQLDVVVRDLHAGTNVVASLSSTGEAGNDHSSRASLSADGSRVAFQSRADNLVPVDCNSLADSFVRDLRTGVTVRVSVAADDTEGGGLSTRVVLSRDGQRVAFQSSADNFAAPDGNRTWDVFLRGVAP